MTAPQLGRARRSSVCIGSSFWGLVPLGHVHGSAVERQPPDVLDVGLSQASLVFASAADDQLVGPDPGRDMAENPFHQSLRSDDPARRCDGCPKLTAVDVSRSPGPHGSHAPPVTRTSARLPAPPSEPCPASRRGRPTRRCRAGSRPPARSRSRARRRNGRPWSPWRASCPEAPLRPWILGVAFPHERRPSALSAECSYPLARRPSNST